MTINIQFNEAIRKAKKKIAFILFIISLIILIPVLSYYFNNTLYYQGYLRYNDTENLNKVMNWLLIDDEYVEDIDRLNFFPVNSKVVFESSGELLIWGETREIIIKTFDDEDLKKQEIEIEFEKLEKNPILPTQTLHLSTMDYDNVPFDAYYIGKGDIVTIYNMENEIKDAISIRDRVNNYHWNIDVLKGEIISTENPPKIDTVTVDDTDVANSNIDDSDFSNSDVDDSDVGNSDVNDSDVNDSDVDDSDVGNSDVNEELEYKIMNIVLDNNEEQDDDEDENVNEDEEEEEEEDDDEEDDDEEDEDEAICNSGFPDVSSESIYCEAVAWAKEKGIFKGYDDGEFKLDKDVIRVEILKVILLSQNLEIENYDGQSSFSFIDVYTDQWYMPFIQTGYNLGVFQGDAKVAYVLTTTARPGDTVNRAEALKLLFETRNVANKVIPQCSVNNFIDVEKEVWFEEYACLSKEFDLFELENNNTLKAANLSTRGEIVLMLYRLFEALDN